MTGPDDDAPMGTDTRDRLRRRADRRLRSRQLVAAGAAHGPAARRAVEPAPLVIGAATWEIVERGLLQRHRLLEALIDDLYGPDPRLIGRVVPAEVVHANPAFVPAAAGWTPAGSGRLSLTGFDLSGIDGGRPVVRAVRVADPGPLGRLLETRTITAELLGDRLAETGVRPLTPFLVGLRRRLGTIATAERSPRVIVLSPGADHPAHADLGELARILGYTLAEAADVTVRRGAVHLRSVTGLEPVHVVLRGIGDEAIDALEVSPAVAGGVPGLLAAARARTVTVADAIGTGWLHSPILDVVLPAVARHLDADELHLPGPRRLWCGDDDGQRETLARLGEFVLEPLDPTAPTVDTRLVGRAELDGLRAEIERRPWWWTAREPDDEPTLRTYVTVDSEGGDAIVLPGGHATLSADESVAVDVWVGGGGSTSPAPTLRPAGLGQVDLAASLPSQAGEALLWFGRYLERSEHLLRRARAVIDLAATSTEPLERPWLPALLPGPAVTLLVDPERVDGLRPLLDALVSSASSVRGLLPTDLWSDLDRIDTDTAELADPHDVAAARALADRLLAALAGIAGTIAESMVRDPGWYLLDIGRRLERALGTVRMLEATLAVTTDRPDDDLLEMLLTVVVSLNAYRRRYRSDLEADATLGILLVDATNPRSVRAAAQAVVDDLGRLPNPSVSAARTNLTAVARRIVGTLDRVDVPALVDGDDTGAARRADVLAQLRDDLHLLGSSTSDTFFRHTIAEALPSGTVRRRARQRDA